MSHPDRDNPRDLDEVVHRLRTERHTASALELDEIKRRAMAQASRTQGGVYVSRFNRSRLTAVVLALGLAVSGGTAGVIAQGQGGGNDASKGAYHPGCNGHGPGDSKHGGKHEKWRDCA